VQCALCSPVEGTIQYFGMVFWIEMKLLVLYLDRTKTAGSVPDSMETDAWLSTCVGGCWLSTWVGWRLLVINLGRMEATGYQLGMIDDAGYLSE
jgi:hypothetical protein